VADAKTKKKELAILQKRGTKKVGSGVALTVSVLARSLPPCFAPRIDLSSLYISQYKNSASL